jgi:hypothetical protein
MRNAQFKFLTEEDHKPLIANVNITLLDQPHLLVKAEQ